MPSAGSWLTSLRDPDAQLWTAANQLFEAVDFMHQQGVAHLDLKPANILVPLDGGRLSVIHPSALRVRAMLRGRVGTPGYMPPRFRLVIACSVRSVPTCGPVGRRYLSCANAVRRQRIERCCSRSLGR
ncbi:hypothetical protein BD779DRAFT_509500 [Infundibulicybe gibba]|nr:hypothetical protein BD779DRAFT_509500 [Infundibulicybe gibba]